jgi:hypothetical protein
VAADAAAIRDGRAIEAGGEQLQERHDPVLPSGHPGDQIVGCAEFVGIIAHTRPQSRLTTAGTGAATVLSHLNAQFVTNHGSV